jgi:hypothetical protein
MNRLLRAIWCAAIILGLAPRVHAQAANFDWQQVLWKFNLNATSESFYALPATAPVPGSALIETSGASTTITAVSGTPFANLAAGDTLFITDSLAGGGESYTKTIVTRTSSTSIVVNNTISPDVTANLVNATFSYKKLNTDVTGNNAGAFGVPYRSFTVVIQLDQIVVTDYIDFKLYCRAAGASKWIQQAPVVTPPATSATAYQPTAAWWVAIDASGLVRSECRVGASIHTADDGNDLTTNSEQVSIYVLGLK